jgi:hypothetical protein
MRTAVLLSWFMLLAGCAMVPTETVTEPLGQAGQKWAAVEGSLQMVTFYRGTFDALNFTVKETGERFCLVFGGDKVSLMGGRYGLADLDVTITQANVDAVARLAADGRFDGQDPFEVMQVLYAPIARAFFTGSFLNNEIIRKFAGVEDLIHITFLNPGRPEGPSVTLKAEGNQWYVIDGLEGKPKRVFRLNEAETLNYMHQVHKTRKSENPMMWLEFVDWYRKWKDQVSVVPAAG